MQYSFVLAGLLAGTAFAVPYAQGASSASSAAPTINPSATVLAGNPSAAPNPQAEPGFVSTLLNADSTVDRFTQIQDEITKQKASLVFDFNPAANPAVTPGAGGAVFLANRVNYPAVTNLGISGATLFFAPCGLNTPHTHPRGTEFLTVATDSTITSGFVLENGFPTELTTNLTQYQGTVFPMGSIHWQQNQECEPAVAIAALSSDDPGASSIAQNFIVNTAEDVIEATLGFPEQITPDNFAQFKTQIPKPFVRGVLECYQRCGFST